MYQKKLHFDIDRFYFDSSQVTAAVAESGRGGRTGANKNREANSQDAWSFHFVSVPILCEDFRQRMNIDYKIEPKFATPKKWG